MLSWQKTLWTWVCLMLVSAGLVSVCFMYRSWSICNSSVLFVAKLLACVGSPMHAYSGADEVAHR
jgi:hypothetical protein